MEQFIVPQFIDVEDKILGPITTRQFVLMLVGTLITFIFYKLFTFWTFAGLGALNIGTVAIFAFAKINGRPIHFFLLNFLQTQKRARLRIWNRESYVYAVKVVSELKEEKKVSLSIAPREPITGSRLSDLTLVINTGGVYGGEEFK
jgi:hypothetical protein